MTSHAPPFPDGPDPLGDPELLLELAAWADGTLPPDRLAGLEARLAEDPRARALAASARLRPVTPADAAAPVPVAVVARAAALAGSGAATAAVETDRSAPTVPARPAASVELVARGLRRPAPLLRGAVAAAACIAALLGGWRLGDAAARPEPAAGGPLVAGGVTAAPAADDRPTDDPADEGALLAAASFGVFGAEEDDPLEFLMLVDADSEMLR